MATGQKEGDVTANSSLSEENAFFLPTEVEKHRNEALKIRLKALISAKGLSQADFYKNLGLSKDYWYMISWGKVACPLDLKIRISQALGVDSSIIWQEGEK